MNPPIKWRRVTRAFPCAICKKPNWCTVSEIGSCCMRIESGHLLKNGGWLHRDETKSRPLPPTTPKAPTINATKIMAEFCARTTPEMRERVAKNLGVDCGTIVALGAAWAEQYQAWAWPMSDGYGNVIGIRLRSDTRKWAVTGSRSGLFLPRNVSPQKRLFVTEGPTDCCAALSMGLFSIGRPSCTGGSEYIQIVIRRFDVRELVIICDNDEPGLRGAQLLADILRVPSCTYVPPVKDIRAGLQLGMTRATIESSIRGLLWQQPRNQQQAARDAEEVFQ